MKRFALLLAWLLAAPAFAATLNVASPTDPQWTTLNRGTPVVFASAQPGDTIVFGPGAYGPLNPGLNVTHAAPGVAIKAADGAAVTFSAGVFSGGGWHVSGVKFTGGVSVANADSVSFDHVEVAGVVPADLTTMTGAGLSYRNVTNLSVTNSSIHHFGTALTGLNAVGLTLTDDSFSYSSSDLVHLGGNLSNALIARNLFTQVHSKDLVHQDGLQIFFNGATAALDHITIADNRIIRGPGGAPVQGIFLQGLPSSNLGLTNLTVTGNLVMTGNYWCVGASGAVNFTIKGNYCGGFSDALNGTAVMFPWIKALGSSNGVIADNITNGGVQTTADDTAITQSNNGHVELAAPDDLGAANAWLAAKTAPAPVPVPAVNPLQATVDALNAQAADLAAKLKAANDEITALQAKIAAAVAALA